MHSVSTHKIIVFICMFKKKFNWFITYCETYSVCDLYLYMYIHVQPFWKMANIDKKENSCFLGWLYDVDIYPSVTLVH